MVACCCCCWLLIPVLLFVLLKVISFFKSKQKVSDYGSKAVFITGCDSGFGNMTALNLDKLGFKVFAGCLTKNGIEEISERASENLTPILVDVTKQDSIDEAFEIVKKECPSAGLWAVINNAGVFKSGLLDIAPQFDYVLQMNVNVLGIVAVTRTFLPLLRTAKGRIINVASVAGRLATGGTGGYSASKYAVEGLSDAWRRELKIWGIKVVIIEPGIMKTPLWAETFSDNLVDTTFDAMPDDRKQLYGRQYIADSVAAGRKIVSAFGGDPKKVVNALVNAVCAKHPPARKQVGTDAPLFVFLSTLPTGLQDFLVKVVFERDTVLPQALKK